MKASEIKINDRINIGITREEIEFVGIVTKIEDCKIFMQVMELYNCVYSGFLEDVENEDIAVLDLHSKMLIGDGFEINLNNSYCIFSDEEIAEIHTIDSLKFSIRESLVVIRDEIEKETNCEKLEKIKRNLGSIYL